MKKVDLAFITFFVMVVALVIINIVQKVQYDEVLIKKEIYWTFFEQEKEKVELLKQILVDKGVAEYKVETTTTNEIIVDLNGKQRTF